MACCVMACIVKWQSGMRVWAAMYAKVGSKFNTPCVIQTRKTYSVVMKRNSIGVSDLNV